MSIGPLRCSLLRRCRCGSPRALRSHGRLTPVSTGLPPGILSRRTLLRLPYGYSPARAPRSWTYPRPPQTRSHSGVPGGTLQMELHAPIQHLRAQGSMHCGATPQRRPGAAEHCCAPASTSFSSTRFTTFRTRFNQARVRPALWLTMIDIRLGQLLYSGITYCPRCATRPGPTLLLDPVGRHALICKIVEVTTRRPNALRDTVIQILSRPPFR